MVPTDAGDNNSAMEHQVAQLYSAVHLNTKLSKSELEIKMNLQVFTILWSFNATKSDMNTFWNK